MIPRKLLSSPRLWVQFICPRRSNRLILDIQSCSRVGSHLIGAVSVASSATKAMHKASTAQEVIVIAPEAAHLEFRVRPIDRETGRYVLTRELALE